MIPAAISNMFIKHKVFTDSDLWRKYLSQLTSADIITEVNKRITTKYSSLPFSIRIRPSSSGGWRSREHSIMQDKFFITWYIDENVVLPGKIQNLIDSIEYTSETTGLLSHFTYLGEILPSFHLHYGFFRSNQFDQRQSDWHQSHNQNYLVVLKLYDGAEINEVINRLNENPKGFFNNYHHSAQVFGNIELSVYEIEELYQAQKYYEYTLSVLKDIGEIELLSQLIQNVTSFGPGRLQTLFQTFKGPVVNVEEITL